MTYKFDQIAYNLTAKRKPTKEDMKTYIGLEHLVSGSLNIEEFGSDVEIKGEKLIMTKGDVLLGKRNAYLRRAAIAPHDGLFSAHGMILRPKEDVINKDYFPFFIASDIFFDEAIRISVGGLSPTINWKDLKELEFDLPSIEEQKVLAEKLWVAYKVKESYRQLLSTTDEMLKAKFQEMFGDVEQIALGDKLQTTSGGTPSSKNRTYYEGGTIPWLTSGEVRQGTISSTEAYITESGLENSSAKWVPEGSVVIAMYGATVGSVGILKIPVTTNQAVCSILPNEKFNSTFLYYAIQSKYEWMLSQARGAAQPNISQLIIKQMLIPNPPMELQQQFAEIATQAEATKASLRASIEAIDRVIRSLINQ